MVNELNIKQKDTLNRIINKPELQPFFFRKINELKWFIPLEEKGFFSPEKNPKPIDSEEKGYKIVPSWHVTDYFVTISNDLSKPENEEYAQKVLKIIIDTTEYAIKNGFSNYRTWWDFAKVIRKIPPELIKIENIKIIDYWIKDPFSGDIIVEEIGSWLYDLLKNDDEYSGQIAFKLLEFLYSIVFKEDNSGFYPRKMPYLIRDSDIYNYYLNEITNKIAKLSGEKLGIKAVSIFYKELILIIDTLDNDTWSSLWRNAIEDHDQNMYHHDADDIVLSAYRDSLLGFVDKLPAESVSYISNLFNEKYQTIKRIAIYVINEKYDKLRGLINLFLNKKYFNDNFKHELWHLLNKNFSNLDKKQKNKVITIIESLKTTKRDKYKEKRDAYKKLEWLMSIKDLDTYASELYKKYLDITGEEPERPDFSSYISVGHVDFEKSPIPIDNLISLSIDDLVKELESYREKTPRKIDEPGIEGLVHTFKEVVKIKADEFYKSFDNFLDIDLGYIYSLIEAYHELWKQRKELPWDDIWGNMLNYCEKLINKYDFWSVENSKQRKDFIANRHWIVGVIGNLITDGTKSDENAFNPDLLTKSKKVLEKILIKQESEETFNEKSDAVGITINSPRGKCLEALINHSLRACRLSDKANDKKHEDIWTDYKKIYDRELNAENGYEFITLLAMYLPNFLYMSSEWVSLNLKNIFNQEKPLKWRCAIQGYVFVGTVYKQLYDYLKGKGDFIKALDDEFLNDRVKERIVENIIISFFYYDEKLDDSENLINELIMRNKYNELSHLIHFIINFNTKNKDIDINKKVNELWPKILEVMDFDKKDDRKLASDLCSWIIFIEEIDDTKKNWLLKIAPYADEHHNAYKLLNGLARLSDKQPEIVQEIWLKIISKNSFDYPKEAIVKIFENLLKLLPDGKRKAIEIADAYIKICGNERPAIWLNEIIKNH